MDISKEKFALDTIVEIIESTVTPKTENEYVSATKIFAAQAACIRVLAEVLLTHLEEHLKEESN
jgi:hypothetical protein